MDDRDRSGALVDAGHRTFARTAVARNVCVEAGAGTGKTSVLVDRVVRTVASGWATLDRIAVITFTRRAAGEVASRLQAAIDNAFEESDDDAVGARFARARASGPAHVGTIHSLAEAILRSNPVEAGLDPTFRVADPVATRLRFDAERREWLQALLDRDSPSLDRALASGISVAQLSTLAETLSSFRDLSTDFGSVPRPDPLALLESIRPLVAELGDLSAKCVDPAGDRGARQIADLVSFASDAESLARAQRRSRDGDLDPDSDWDSLAWHLLHNGPLEVRKLGNARNWRPSDACRGQKALCGELDLILQAYRRDSRTHALCEVLPLVSEFVEQCATRRGHEGLATFDDLLVRAARLLREHPAVCTSLSERYRCVLVDEFQDTDPLQAEIVMRLTAPGQDALDWHDLRPEEGRLFVVGDPKQSVYRFRRADISIYERVVSDVFGRSGPAPTSAGAAGNTPQRVRHPTGAALLESNFRSVPGVLTWVNNTFGDVFSPVPGIQPDYRSLEPVAPQPGLAGSGAWQSVVAVYERAESPHVDDVREQEAALLGDTLVEGVAGGAWQVRERGTGALRPARWGDVAILARTRTGMVLYEEALEGRGIPFAHLDRVDLHDRQEVRDLIAVLRAVERPDDQVSFLAAARSLAFGCSDDDIFRAHASGHRLTATQAPGETVPESVRDTISVLRALDDHRQAPLVELVYRAIDATNLADTVATLPNGRQLAANVDAVVDVARTFVAGGGHGLGAFLDWIDGGTVGTEATGRDPGGEDAVQLVTMHGSKGLEFPIVALVDLYQQRCPRPTVVPDREQGHLHVRVGTVAHGARTPGFDDEADVEAHHADSELRRLLYVAATRSRDRLVFPLAVPHRHSADDMLSWVLPHLIEIDSADGGIRPAPGVSVLTPTERSGPGVPGSVGGVPDPPSRGEGAERDGAIPATSAAIADPARVAQITRTLDRWQTDRDETLASGARRSTVVSLGTAGDTTESDHRPAIRTLMAMLAEHRGGDREDEREALVAAVAATAPAGTDEIARAVLSTEVARRAMRSTSLVASPSVTVPTDEGFLEGHLDLAFTDETGLVAVTVTTEPVPSSGPGAHRLASPSHTSACVRALHKATGIAVSEYAVVFACDGVEHSTTELVATAASTP